MAVNAKTQYGPNHFVPGSAKGGISGLKDPIKPWTYELYFNPVNVSALNSVKDLWGNPTSPNCLRTYQKSIKTPDKQIEIVKVPFFGIDHPYAGKPKPTQEFEVECVEHENLVIMTYIEKWHNLITNYDPELETGNSEMFSFSETIYDLTCNIDIKNLGVNAKELPRYYTYMYAWPSKIISGEMANQNESGPVKKKITFTCLMSLNRKNN